MRREEVIVVACVAVLAAGWWLFGFSTESLHSVSMRLHRVWGRVVRADIDSNSDGQVDQSLRFSWREPMYHHQPPQRVLTDADYDGRWDLWVVPGRSDTDGYPLATFSVDTDGDGRADWTFVDRWQSREAYAKIRARRGF